MHLPKQTVVTNRYALYNKEGVDGGWKKRNGLIKRIEEADKERRKEADRGGFCQNKRKGMDRSSYLSARMRNKKKLISMRVV